MPALQLLAHDGSTIDVSCAVASRCATLHHALEAANDRHSPSSPPRVPLPAFLPSDEVRKLLELVESAHAAKDGRTAPAAAAYGTRIGLAGEGAPSSFALLAAANFLEAQPILRQLEDAAFAAIHEPFATLGPTRGAEALASIRRRFVVPIDLSAAEAAASVSESALTAEPPHQSDEYARCALCAFPGGDDVLESILCRLPVEPLRQLKGISRAWRAIARRILSSPRWQAAHVPLPLLLRWGASARVVLARLDGRADEAAARGGQSYPLHLACAGGAAASYFSSLELVRALLQAYPEAARKRDELGLTPLHLAAKAAAPTEWMREIIQVYPDAPRQRVWHVMPLPRGGSSSHGYLAGAPQDDKAEHMGQVPLHLAASSGRGEATHAAIHFLLSAFPDGAQWRDMCGRYPLHCAIIGGAPDAAVLEILEAWSEAAGHPIIGARSDPSHPHHGKLPLLLALELRPTATPVISALLQANPSSGPLVLEHLLEKKLQVAAPAFLAQQLISDIGGAGTNNAASLTPAQVAQSVLRHLFANLSRK
ncbi:hypothetical protein AB1Y20_022579 [Prymnesium parvum]|uniref:Uncharacterized protein n=1 Tax=Prymnesium parvum TaxID=97485 RepID=A0AB34JGN2_PRYPA